MSYKPTNWIDEETPVNAENLNKLERAVQENSAAVEEITATLRNYTPSWNDLPDKPFGDDGGSVTVLAETEYAFTLNANINAHSCDINPAPFTLVEGETYRVKWDGDEFPCTATSVGEGNLGLGNLVSFGYEGGNADAPFVIGCSAAGVTMISFDDKASHKLAISQGTGEVKTLDAKYLPMDAIDARIGEKIEAYISEALGGDY